MISSKSLNRAEPTILGWPKKRSLKAGIVGLTFLIVFYAFVQSLDFGFWLFLAIFFFFGPLLTSEWLFGRNEDWTNKKLEALLNLLRGKKEEALSAERLRLTGMAYDKDSLYTVDGWEYFGFRPSRLTNRELGAESIKLLKDLPLEYVIKFIRFNRLHSSDFLSKHRPALASHRLTTPGYYIVIGRNMRLTKTAERNEFLSEISSSFIRLTETELKQFNEYLFNPSTEPRSGDEKARFSASHKTDGKFSWVYPSECYGALSLVELPDEVDSSFHKFFEAFEGHQGYIMTRFEKQSQQKEEITQAFKTFKLLQSNAAMWLAKDSVKAEKIRKNLEDRSRGLGANLKMFLNCLVYGSPDEVTRTLKNIGKRDDISATSRPSFQVDSGFIKESVASIAIGRRDSLPLREQRLDSIEEASFYLPPLVNYAPPTIEHPLVYRTKHNVPKYIDHANLEETPITLLVGKSGYGKSMMLSQMIKAHLKLEELYRRPVAVIMGDVGGSAEWLEDNGISDLSFDLSRKDGADFKPLPIHPFHIFLNAFSLEKAELKTADILPLRNFILSLIGADPLDAGAGGLVIEAIRAMAEGERSYEITKFHGYLKKAIDREMGRVPESAREEFELSWYGRLTKLCQYTKGGIYNHIFEPKSPDYQSIEHVRVFYYNLDEEDFNNPDLVRPFLNLCYATAQQLSSKFKSTNTQGRDVLECIDEFDKQARFLPISSLKDKKDQARKYGQIPVLCIQSFDYLSRKNEHGEFDNTIYEGVGRTFFWQVGQEKVYSKVAAIFDEPYLGGAPGPKLSQMLEIANNINEQRKLRDDGVIDANMPRPVGFFDTNKIIDGLIVDVETEILWETTTKPGGRKIRKFVRDRLGLSLDQAAKYLTAKLGNKIPAATPSDEWLAELIGE